MSEDDGNETVFYVELTLNRIFLWAAIQVH